MGKIKLNLTSGASVEKPLICAFNADLASYVILDNEVNGSMGLPIILVCKLENNKLIKIESQEEWGKVKGHLKNIISGNNVEYISVAPEMMADDIYYTQLTLPVASFDALKSSYNIEENGNSEIVPSFESVPTTNEVVPPVVEQEVVPNPMENVVNPEINVGVTPDVNNNVENNIVNDAEVNVTPQIDDSTIEPAIPVIPQIETPSVEPVIVSPIVDEVPVAPVEPVVNNENKIEETISFAEAPINPEPIITPTPVIDTNIVSNTNNTVEEDLFKEQKEAFMQACENMFDALVQKFKKELENK